MKIDKLGMIAAMSGEIWAMDEDRFKSFTMACASIGETAEDWRSSYFPMKSEMRFAQVEGGKVAIIPVKGGLMHKCPSIYEELGLVTRYQSVQDNIQIAKLDPSVKGIVFHIDSGGGTVAGCVETAEMIASIDLPTAAYCEWMACSAAYWIASQTDYIVSGKSATIGNVGAILTWADLTGYWEAMGVEFKALVSEGATLKSTFHLEPNDEQISFLQESINNAGASFVEAVKNGRSKSGVELSDEVWKAGWYSGDKAIQLGLSDDIGGIEKAIVTISE